MKVEHDKVLDEIIELKYVKGYTTRSILHHLNEKYDLQQSRSYELIRDALDKAAEIYGEENRNAIRDSILFIEEQIQKLIKSGDNKTALAYQRELNKVNQLYVERQEIKITGQIDVKNLFGFEDEEKEGDKSE